MADNTSTKVLTIDTGNAITNVKEFKQRIEDLKGTLLGLERGTEQYNTVAKELRDNQQKLTEVMDVARGKAEGVEGSYDNLVATMRDLKTAWRATADEAERAQLGQQILEINNQLKELDASTGNFQRNVGDYANAFEEAFKTTLSSVRTTDSAIGKLAGSVNSLIPIMKKLNQTVTAGLSGAEKLLAGAGIGAVIVGLTILGKELVSTWSKATKEMKDARNTLSDINNLEKNIEQITENIDNVTVGLTKEQEQQLRLMDAQGTSARAILESQILMYETNLKDLDAEIEKTRQMKAQAEAKKAIIEANRSEAISNPYDAEGGFYLGSLNNQEAKVDESISKLNEALNTSISKRGEFLGEIEILKAKLENLDKTSNETTSSIAKDNSNQIDAILKRLEVWNKTELELLEAKYKEEKALLEGAGEDTTKLTEEYEAERTRIIAEADLKRLELEEENEKMRMDMAVKNANKTISALEGIAKNKIVRLNLDYELAGAGKSNDILANFQREADKINGIFNIQKDVLQGKIDTLQNLLEQLDPESEQYLSTKEQLAQATIELDNLTTQNYLDNKDLEDAKDKEVSEKRKERLAIAQEGIASLGSPMSSVADIMEENIKQEVENGKISEEEAKKQFERVKGVQIAAAVMSTAAGAIGAFAQTASAYPAPWGPILGAVAAAAVVAAGAVQIAQIKRQKYGSSDSSSNSVSTPNLRGATNMVQVQPVQNMTGQSELTELSNAISSQTIVVKVTDVEDTQAIQNATIAETTF